MNERANQVCSIVHDHLTELQKQFKHGVKLTFIARVPWCDTADMVVTSDDLNELVKVVERMKAKEAEDACTKQS